MTLKVLILIIGLACILPIYGQQEGAKSSTQKGNPAKPTNPNPPTAPSITNVINQQATDSQKQNPDDHPKKYLARLLSAENLPNDLLVLVGVIATVIAICTLKNIGRQTDHMVNSERAWVLISVVHPPDIISTTAPGTALPANHFVFDIVNTGRTVARLIELRGGSKLVRPEERLPEQPQYSIATAEATIGYSYGGVLAPNASLGRLNIAIDQSINLDTFNDIRNYRVMLYVYGFIRYFDFAKEERRLQFSYRYIPSGFRFDTVRGGELLARWVLTGPRDYNTHT
jgi:hypothetical protein